MTDVNMDPSQAVRSRNSSESMEDLQLVCIMCKKQGDLSTFFGRYCSDDCVNASKLLKNHSLNASFQNPDFRREQGPKTIHSNKSKVGQSENFKIDSKSMNSEAAIKIEKSPAQKELRKCSNCGAWTTNPTYCTRQCFNISRKKMRKKRMQGHQSDFLKSKQTLSRHKLRVNLHSKCISCGKDAKGKLVCSTVCRARNASAYVKNKNHNSNTSVFVDNHVQNSMKRVHGISDQKVPSTICSSPTKMSPSGMSYDEKLGNHNGNSPSHITPLDDSRRKYIVESSSCTWPSDSSIHVANIRSISKQDEYSTQHARNYKGENKGACDASSKEYSSAMFTLQENIEQQANQLSESHNLYRQDVTRHRKERNFMNQHSVDTENYHGFCSRERDPVIPRQNSPNLSTNRANRHNDSTNSRPKNAHYDYANSTPNGRNVSSNSRSNSDNDSSNLRLHSQDVSSRLDSHNDSSNSRQNFRDFFSHVRPYSLGLTLNSRLNSKDTYFNSKQRSHDNSSNLKRKSNSRQNSLDDPTNERLYAQNSSSNSRLNSHDDISSSRLHGHNDFSVQNSCDDFSNSQQNFNDKFSNPRRNSLHEFLNSRQNFHPESSNRKLHSQNIPVNSRKNSHHAPPNSRPHTEDDSSNSRINFNNSSTARRLSQNESFPPGRLDADDNLKINRSFLENNLAFMNRMLLSEDSEIYRLHCDEIKSQIALNKTKEEYFRCEISKSRLEHKLMFEKLHPSHN